MDTTLTDPLIGQLLDGRYRVESRIARGGMASVYLALDVRLERTVAVKVMHRSLAEDPQFVRRFIGEAKSVAGLSHPNIVQVFDQGTDGAHVYLSMEYVPGRTLRDVLHERERLPARESLEMVIPVLAALGSAHQAGLIHRDVKPENVLLADDGRVKVVDFGLARAIEATNQTKTGMMIGTIGYMSPEQVTTGQADARSDVYAAGILLFELLTGRQPYEGESPMSIAYRHVHDHVPAPSSIAPDVPPSLDALVAAATDRDPARRPADANAMLIAAVETHRGIPRTGHTAQHRTHHTGGHPASPTGSPSGPFGSPGSQPGVFQAPPPLVYVKDGAEDDPAGQTMIQPLSELPTEKSRSAGASARTRRRSPRPIWFIAGLALVMVAGIAFSGWWFSQSRVVKVPDLVGQNIVLARQAALNAGFEVKVGQARFDDKMEKDNVLDTEPGPGAEVDKGSVLTLIPSAGPETVPVPDVANLSEAEARTKISDAGLKVGRVSKNQSDTVPRGQVIGTNPAAGKRVKKGGGVNLVISLGLLMPDVSQMMRDQAEKFLRDKGFNVQVDETDNSAPHGTVIAQDPVGGTPVMAGDSVRLTVSRGPDEGWHWPWENNDSEAPPDFVVVPDVRFRALKDAQRELRAAGFKVKTRKLVGTRRVIEENPRGRQPMGATITVWH
ncbi:Stk1 family PASTA domain-containing Ser/Thr kinase [Sphaerimonospora sp. CA-214678]|uniref:Stk1 family PASTA domain-containing Ser/Thr kinase n=1 Tax=Sphaerimonospora sp. CA-214678 TaxID=3240029 RepID=UPI003D8BD42D